MKKLILTALFLAVMASFLLESPSPTRLQEKKPTLPKQRRPRPLLEGEAGNLKVSQAAVSAKIKEGSNVLFANSSGLMETPKTSREIETRPESNNYPTVNPNDPN